MKDNPSRHAPEEIDRYLAELSKDRQEELERVRQMIRKCVPDCTERIAYQIPVFRLNKDLVGLASQKKHLSFYTMSPDLVKVMKTDLAGFQVSGATIHFTPDHAMPEELIQKILNYRLKEIQQEMIHGG